VPNTWSQAADVEEHAVPELPEVETTARLVAPHVRGRRIEAVEVTWERTLGGTRRAAFEKAVVKARIHAVGRRAKWIVLGLRRGRRPAGALLVHLRMSGRLLVGCEAREPCPHVRVRLALSGGGTLAFLDVRKFGRVLFASRPDLLLGDLGPEPLDAGFTADALREALAGRRGALKPLLLDQGFLAGLGNIYVDEALHRARLHPLRRADRLTPQAVRALHAAIRDVLTRAIEAQGSSFDGFYRTPQGRPGAYQAQLAVYGRAGKPCPRCGNTIRRLVVGQRGTHVCLRCQRAPARPGGRQGA
jgi:formamidopyrimidine-DNA glycosylase